MKPIITSKSSTEYLYALNAVSAHSVALLGSREQGRKKMILRAMSSNLKQQESKVDEIIGAVEAIIGQQKPELRSYLHELKMGLQARLLLQCSDTQILGKKLKEDPSSDPSLATWWLHRLNRLGDRSNEAIRKIGIALNDDEAIRSDEVADPRPHKTQVHVSLEKTMDTSDKLPLGDLEKHQAGAAGRQTRPGMTEVQCSSKQNSHMVPQLQATEIELKSPDNGK